MAVKDNKDAEMKALTDPMFKQFMAKNKDAKVVTRKIDAKEMERIMKEHPKMFKDVKPKEVMMVQAMKPTLGIPEESQKTVFIDPKTGKVLLSF
jgi:ABC-type antimicrobial peptide transport system ATPase subunit